MHMNYENKNKILLFRQSQLHQTNNNEKIGTNSQINTASKQNIVNLNQTSQRSPINRLIESSNNRNNNDNGATKTLKRNNDHQFSEQVNKKQRTTPQTLIPYAQFQFKNTVDLCTIFQLLDQRIKNQQYAEIETSALQILNFEKITDEQKITLYRYLIFSYKKQRKYVSAVQVIESLSVIKSITGINNIKAQFYNDLAIECNNQGEYNAAINLIDKGLFLNRCSDATKIELYNQQAIAYNMQGKYAEVIKITSHATDIQGSCPDTKASLYSQQAAAYVKQNEYDKAIRALNQGLGIKSISDIMKILLYKNLSFVYKFRFEKNQDSKDRLQALIFFSRALDCCLKEKKDHKIYSELLQDLKKFGSFADNLIILATSASKLNELYPSKEDLGIAMKIALKFLLDEMNVEKNNIKITNNDKIPNNYQPPQVLIPNGVELQSKGTGKDVNDVVEFYNKAIKLNKQGEYDKAIKAIKEGLEVCCLDYTKMELYYQLAFAYNKLGKYAEVSSIISAVENIQKYYPNTKALLFGELGHAYMKLNEFNKAIEVLYQGLDIGLISDMMKSLLCHSLSSVYYSRFKKNKDHLDWQQSLMFLFHALDCLKEKKDPKFYSTLIRELKQFGSSADNLSALAKMTSKLNEPYPLNYQPPSKEDLGMAMQIALNLLLDEMGVGKLI